jgi:NCS1 family nucleobase:cation symporter-1
LTKSALIETHSIDYVPLRERHGKVWHLWSIWFMGEANLATVATGVIGPHLGLNLAWSAIAVFFGCAFGTFFMAFHSTQGPQLGLPQMIQSRPQFGYLGALLVWVVALITYIGFNAFNEVLAGETMHTLVGADPTLTIVVFALLGLGLAIVGYDWIHKVQRWLTVAMMALLLVFTIGGLFAFDLPPEQFSLVGFAAVPFLTQFFAAAAYQISWAIYVSDYSRYLPPTVGVMSSFLWTYLGAMIGGVWMMLVGTVAAARFANIDLSSSLLGSGDLIFPGFGLTLVIASMLGLITITTLNFYGASLTLLSVADCIVRLRYTVRERVLSLAVLGVAATAIALAASETFTARFSDLLAVLLYLFTPWTAINLVDFYYVRRGHYSVREMFNPNGLYGSWSWRGLIAYAIGFVVMIPFFSTGMYTGDVAEMLGGADIAMVVGLPVSTIVYLIACRSLDVEGEREKARIADLDLETAPLA